jgi:hypothetical protein
MSKEQLTKFERNARNALLALSAFVSPAGLLMLAEWLVY